MKVADILRHPIQSFRALKSIPFEGGSGGQGWGWYPNATAAGLAYQNTQINYASELSADLANEELMAAAVRWVSKNVADARLYVARKDSDNKETELEHPVTQLFKRPNPYYSGRSLWRGVVASWLSPQAVAYIRKVRNTFGQPIQLWWEPHTSIRPRWNADGSGEFVTHYEVYRNGRWYRIETEDVIVLRDGLDPVTRLGCNGMNALLDEFYADRKGARYMSVLLKHGLVPPVAIGVGDANTPGPTGDAWQAIKDQTYRQFREPNAGKPFMYNGPIKVAKLGFDYSSVGMKDVRRIPAERFCAVVGISAQSLRLSIEDNNTYNNVASYMRGDYIDYIKPTQRVYADEIELQLLPEFGDSDGLMVGWDYTGVDLLEPDKASEWERIGKAYDDGRLKRSEAREAMGYQFEKDVDDVYKIKNTESLIHPDGSPQVEDDEPDSVNNIPDLPGAIIAQDGKPDNAVKPN